MSMKHSCAIGAILVGSLASSAFAESYDASTLFPPSAITVSVPYIDFADRVAEATGGEIVFTVHSGGSLLPAAETLQGVSDGLAVVGEMLAPYTPADLPLNNVINDLGFLQVNAYVAAFAATEVRFDNPAIQEEWLDHGIVYGGNWSTSTYHLRCVPQVRNLTELAGKRVRASVGAQIDFLKSVGAVPVSVPGTEIYSGLERGSLDCTLIADESLSGLRVSEVVDYTTVMPLGVFISGASWGYNQDFWRDIGPKNRRILLDLMAEQLVRVQIGLRADDAKAAAEAQEVHGVQWQVADRDLIDAKDAFMDNFIETLPQTEMEKRNVDDPSALIDQFLAAQEKWTRLLDGVDPTDEETLIDLVRTHIYDKVDENSYGL